MTDEDRAELARLLGLDGPVGPDGPVGMDGLVVPGGGHDHYVEYIDRAEGRTPRVIGAHDPWDS